MMLSFLLAQDPGPSGSGGVESIFGHPMTMIVILFVMMYFLLIRPQQKQRKEQAARVAAIEKGDKVITAGGLHATVHHVSEKTITLKLSEGVFVPFEKSAISTVNKRSKGDDKPAAESKDKDSN